MSALAHPIIEPNLRFGRLTALREETRRGSTGTTYRAWLCRCDCGQEKWIAAGSLLSFRTKSCGCRRVKDLTGQRFGRLVALDYELRKNGTKSAAVWRCQCDCGSEKRVTSNCLQRGYVKSCGCLQREAPRLAPGEAARNQIIRSYRKGAQQRGHVFALSNEEFFALTAQACYYCGAAPSSVRVAEGANGQFTYNGVDRRNSNIGYVSSNCVPCCTACNRAKGTLSEPEFLALVRRIYDFRGLDG